MHQKNSDWEPNLDQVAGGMVFWIDLLQIDEGLDIALAWVNLWTWWESLELCRSAMATQHCHRIAETKRRHQTHHTPGELHQACGSSSVPSLGQGNTPSLGTTPDGSRERGQRAAGP